MTNFKSTIVNELNLDELYRIHDDDPTTVSTALFNMAASGVAVTDHVRFAWLVNHVVGEKEGEWETAYELLEKSVSESDDSGVLRHRVIAALFVGNPLKAFELLFKFASSAEISTQLALAAVQLGVFQFSKVGTPALELAGAFCTVVEEIYIERRQMGKIATIIAAGLNNTTSRLMDDKNAPKEDLIYKQALMRGAEVCKGIWAEVGTWMNCERADYLVALCANRIDNFDVAKQAALTGLNTIDNNGSEDVDRAFLLIELSRALHGLGDHAQSELVRVDAQQLAQAFDPGLREWFDSRAQA